jgi:hypothetical protein
VALLFLLRCLVPLGILFGISYLLRRLELVNKDSNEVLLEAGDDVVITSTTPNAARKNPTTKSRSPKKMKKNGENQSDTSKKKGLHQ